MSDLSKKRPFFHDRLKEVRKELSAIRKGVRSLKETPGRPRVDRDVSASAGDPGDAGPGEAHAAQALPPDGQTLLASTVDSMEPSSAQSLPESRGEPSASRARAGKFRRSGPLRHERRIQRNKALAMLIVALLLLVWVFIRFLWPGL